MRRACSFEASRYRKRTVERATVQLEEALTRHIDESQEIWERVAAVDTSWQEYIQHGREGFDSLAELGPRDSAKNRPARDPTIASPER